uniref:Uncharacterized protein n=1 Tax=Chlorocebus sabaeus TaxID=60711 RepID=A0A0D9SBT0_CHLSB
SLSSVLDNNGSLQFLSDLLSLQIGFPVYTFLRASFQVEVRAPSPGVPSIRPSLPGWPLNPVSPQVCNEILQVHACFILASPPLPRAGLPHTIAPQ